MKFLNERGYALFLTIAVITLISILALGLIKVTTNSQKTTVNERYDQSLFYIAESGINLEKSKISTIIGKIYTNTITTLNNATTLEEQLKLLNGHNIDSYFYSELNKDFCAVYNTTSSEKSCTPSQNGAFSFENTYDYFTLQFNEQPISKTTVLGKCEGTPLSCSFELQSNGYFSNSPTRYRKLNQTIIVDLDAPNPISHGGGNGSGSTPHTLAGVAVYTKGDITLSNGAIINGQTNSGGGNIQLFEGSIINGDTNLTKGNISINKSSINGNVGVTNGNITVTEGKLNGESILLSDTSPLDIDLFLPEFPTNKFDYLNSLIVPPDIEKGQNPWDKTKIIDNGKLSLIDWKAGDYTYKLNQDTKLNKLSISSNYTLTLDIGENEINLFVNELNITQGHIKIIGTGKINIYTNKIINETGNSSIKGTVNQNGNSSQLNLFYSGTQPLTLTDEFAIAGSLHIKSANLFANLNTFKGNIYSGGNKIEITGGTKTKGQYIVAPNAHLTMNHGGVITGTVLVDKLTAIHGNIINFGESVVTLPIVPGAPSSYSPANNFLLESALIEQ